MEIAAFSLVPSGPTQMQKHRKAKVCYRGSGPASERRGEIQYDKREFSELIQTAGKISKWVVKWELTSEKA